MDYNNGYQPQQTPNNVYPGAGRNDYCPFCGTSLIGGVCPACGNSVRKPKTAGKAILAIFLTLLVGGIVGLYSLYRIGEQANRNYGYGYGNNGGGYAGTIPEPYNDPLSNGKTDSGFYWNDWSPYLYGYDNYPSDDYGTIIDVREDGLSYSISDFYFIYSGNQELTDGIYGHRATPSGSGVWVDYDAHYVQLSGDNPNIKTINDTIRNCALDGVYYMIEPGDTLYDYMMENSNEYYMSYTYCYVTYMTEDYLSITVCETDVLSDWDYYYIYSLNFDMATGELIELYDVLTPDDAFMEVFDRLGNEQFPDTEGFQAYTSEERRALLDENSDDFPVLILQPNGIQIGYMYDLEDKDIDEYGWLTVEYEMEDVPQAILDRFYQ